MELCPECGGFSELLDDRTGFCAGCSQVHQFADLRAETYLRIHADELEFYIGQGLSIWQALAKLSSSNGRPTCIVCGRTIRYARPSAIFCRATKECRHYSRKYVYLYSERGKSKAEALAQVMVELGGSNV